MVSLIKFNNKLIDLNNEEIFITTFNTSRNFLIEAK